MFLRDQLYEFTFKDFEYTCHLTYFFVHKISTCHKSINRKGHLSIFTLEINTSVPMCMYISLSRKEKLIPPVIFCRDMC